MSAWCRGPLSIGVVVVLLGISAQASFAQGLAPAPQTEQPAATTDISVTSPSDELLGAERAESTAAPSRIALEEPIDPDKYICGPGDLFELNFWGQQNFRLRIGVDPEGRTFISKLGYVTVTGKTLSTVRSDVKRKVKSNYPGLQFDLTLVAPRSFVVHVADFVAKPGAYRSNPLERVSTLIARAGLEGSRRRIKIHRKSGGDVLADLLMYELTGDTSYNPRLLDGDIVSVPPADVRVTVTGAVRRPGSYELIKTRDIAEVMALAGGLTSSAVTTLPARIVRRNDKQQAQFIDVKFSGNELGNAPLKDDDQLLVRSSAELQRTILLIGAVAGADPMDAATASNRLIYIEGDTVLSLIERAGGIKAPGDLRRSYISRPKPNGSPELIPVDLDALLTKRDFRADKPVLLGDVVVVPPMQHSILVEGAVVRAGMYSYNPLFTVSEYVARAGGRTRTARDLDDVKVIDSNGVTHAFDPKLKPSPGDSILVPERNFTRAEIAQLVIASAGLILTGVAVTIAATR